MYHVIAATTNPAKIEAIRLAFIEAFDITAASTIDGTDKTIPVANTLHIESVDVDSGVSSQPVGIADTRTGARQRVMAARQVRPEADFWVGIEAGIDENMTFSWIVIENHLQRGESRSASMILPEIVLQGVHKGHELGDVMANISGISNIKQQGGAIGLFTNGKLSRTQVYYQALLLALVPFHHAIYQPH